jgi:hypothetical protein
MRLQFKFYVFSSVELEILKVSIFKERFIRIEILIQIQSQK